MGIRRSGVFISFEGTEGSGKSTLVKALASLLQEKGYLPLCTREPGGSLLAEKIRSLILSESMPARTELFLYEAARADHVACVIRPALDQGKIVLCDRFTDSTLAYQAYARGLDWKAIDLLNQIATSGLQPDLTVFIDMNPKRGLLRAKDPNRFEAEGLAFQEKVRKGFLKCRRLDPKRWLTLKVSDESPTLLAEQILAHFEKKLRNRVPNRTLKGTKK